jgi:uncharacterized protein (TIGR02594 family)
MRNPYPDFTWFFGTAEDTSSDPLRLGRVRVRAVGFHPSADILPPEQLPYALVLNGGAAKINSGQMVLGFFMDGEEAQQPIIIGVLGGATSSVETPFSTSRLAGYTSALSTPTAAPSSGTAETAPESRPVSGGCPTIKKGLIETARAYIGFNENKDKACLMELFKSQTGQTADPSTTRWCGFFVGAIVRSQGYSIPAGFPSVSSWKSSNYGTTIWQRGKKESKLDVANIRIGDIAVFEWPGGGHVAIVTAASFKANRIFVLGGNQSDSVNEKLYQVNSSKGTGYGLVRVLRPPAASAP